MATKTRRTNATSAAASAPSPGAQDDDKGLDTANSRRMRKRELDRRCQRIARERTKNRIAYLEGLVEDFRKQDSTGQVTTLMRQLSDMAKERDTLVKTLQAIQNSLQAHTNILTGSQQGTSQTWTEPSERRSSANDTDSSDTHPVHKIESPDDGIDVANPFEQSNNEMDPIEPPAPAVIEPYTRKPDNGLGDPIIPMSEAPCECCALSDSLDHGSTINMWRFANEVLTRPTKLSREEIEFEEAIAEDTPIRAVLDGWDAVTRRYGGRLPVSWHKLRQIDEVIFGRCGNSERVAILRAMHNLMRYHGETTEERMKAVPAWHLQRPSQTMAHSYAIDYFAWPGIRERFVFYQHRYCGNSFWHLFCNSLRISWPYEFRDCYTRNLETGQYSFSAAFETRIQDINAWTMKPEIFQRWPEFYSDFPRTSDHLPMQISIPMVDSAQARASHINATLPAQRNVQGQRIRPPIEEITDNEVHESESVMEAAMEPIISMDYWDPLAVIQDNTYPAMNGKGLTELLGQNHYPDFGGRSDLGGGRADFVF